jgi:hypothetical protein
MYAVCPCTRAALIRQWVDTQLYPFPDFGIHKKCVDHDQLLSWQAHNRLSEEQWMEMALRGPGDGESVVPMPEQLRKWAEAEDAGLEGQTLPAL